VSFDVEHIYELLPAIYRIRDTELARSAGLLLDDGEETDMQDLLAQSAPLTDQQAARLQALVEKQRRARGPLKAMLSVIAEQVGVLEEDLAQLYDDLFIETCAEWVVPYIADLVGARGLFVFPNAAFSQRAQVANTIAYRRRKGSASVIEQLARDVTAWDASVVEYFQLLATTQYITNHLRPENLSVAGLRDWESLERLDTPFDRIPRTADVRHIESRRGKYNIPNVGIHLWRIQAFPMIDAPASKVDDHRYLFDALGKDTQLYTWPETEEQITHLAEPINVPAPISRRVLDRYFESYYGPGKSILLKVDGEEIAADQDASPPASPPSGKLSDLLRACDLSNLTDANDNVIKDGNDNPVWAHTPYDKIAIDPVLGRIAFPPTQTPGSVRVTYHYGFSAEMGGGQYGRVATFSNGLEPLIKVPSNRATIQDALDQLKDSGGVVEIENNDIYVETPAINVAAKKKIELRAADKRRPAIVSPGDLTVFGGDSSEVVLNGLLISGDIIVPKADTNGIENKLQLLTLRHCTVVPGSSVLIKSPNLTVEIDHSIAGAIRAVDGAAVHIRNSIVDATDVKSVAYCGLSDLEQGAPLRIENSTVIGTVYTLAMEMASNTIFFARSSPANTVPSVRAERLQQGCVRFSYVPPGSRLPRLYHCQPQSEADAARVRPVFNSLRYGDAAYCQLNERCAIEITEGADDRSEMGAFHDLYQPQRVGNLRARLDEYLRFGLEAGIFLAT
jgi:hypothetical protein